MKIPRSLLMNGDGGAEILGGGRERSAISRCIALFAPVGVVFQVVLMSTVFLMNSEYPDALRAILRKTDR